MRNYTLKSVFACVFVLFSFSSYAKEEDNQTSPTLQVGLNGLTFGKGNLDAKLIMEIIAEKQAEIKARITKNALLEWMNDAGAATYVFSEVILESVINDKDVEVITRKILEQTVNYLFTAYLVDDWIKELNGDDLNKFLVLAKTYDIDLKKEDLNNGVFELLKNKRKNNNDKTQNYVIDKETEFMSLLLDMASYAIMKNQDLKRLGLMRVPYSVSYEYLNKYLNLMQNSGKDITVSSYDFSKICKDINQTIALKCLHQKIIKENKCSSKTNISKIDSLISYTQKENAIYLYSCLEDKLKNEIKKNEKTDFYKSLGNFNCPETYEEYLNKISDISYLFSDNAISQKLSKIASFVKDYVKVTERDNKKVLEVNIESFLVQLQEMKPSRYTKVDFLFNVGVNTAYFFNKQLTIENEPLYNYSYVSEKIGIKFKLADRSWQARSPGETYQYGLKNYVKLTPPKEPFINNWHLILYGSGILYNLINTGNSKNFNSPIFGFGPGITFFNFLDLNMSVGVPLIKNMPLKDIFQYPYFQISFDIRFTEYLSRLNQNRKEKAQQKKIVKALNNQK